MSYFVEDAGDTETGEIVFAVYSRESEAHAGAEALQAFLARVGKAKANDPN